MGVGCQLEGCGSGGMGAVAGTVAVAGVRAGEGCGCLCGCGCGGGRADVAPVTAFFTLVSQKQPRNMIKALIIQRMQ